MPKSIEQVINENPELLSTGWKTKRDSGGEGWPPDVGEAKVAMAFLEGHAVRRRSSNRRQGSYGLKHWAEAWAGEYVSTGALIAAALALGYEVRRFPDSPNCAFNMDVIAPTALRRRA